LRSSGETKRRDRKTRGPGGMWSSFLAVKQRTIVPRVNNSRSNSVAMVVCPAAGKSPVSPPTQPAIARCRNATPLRRDLDSEGSSKCCRSIVQAVAVRLGSHPTDHDAAAATSKPSPGHHTTVLSGPMTRNACRGASVLRAKGSIRHFWRRTNVMVA